MTDRYTIRFDLGCLLCCIYKVYLLLLLLCSKANNESIILSCTLSVIDIISYRQCESEQIICMEWLQYKTHSSSCAKSWLVSNTGEQSVFWSFSSHARTHTSADRPPAGGVTPWKSFITLCPANGLWPEVDNGIMNPQQPGVTFLAMGGKKVLDGGNECANTHAHKGWWRVCSIHHSGTLLVTRWCVLADS